MTANSGVPSAAKLKLDFGYDYRGRRVSKAVWTWSGSNYVGQTTNKFVYDDWNLVAELDHTNMLVRSYCWGLDLSGSLQGAAGVGGLLAVNIATNGVQFMAMDGNGNVAALVGAASGAQNAQYDYGPFEELLRATGSAARANPCRFSTKWQDDETDLMYYGYRYYSSTLGKWLSRDPIETRRDISVYGFNYNAPLQWIDNLGGMPVDVAKPQAVAAGPQEDSCNEYPWNANNVELGKTPWCPSCGRAALTDVGAKLPKVVQECILQHEKQHEKTCPTIPTFDRCCLGMTPQNLAKSLCYQFKDEVAAYAISFQCAEEKLKQQSLTDSERKHLHCYMKNAANNQKVFQEKVTQNKCQ